MGSGPRLSQIANARRIWVPRPQLGGLEMDSFGDPKWSHLGTENGLI